VVGTPFETGRGLGTVSRERCQNRFGGTSGMEGAQSATWSIDKVARSRRRLTHGRAATPSQILSGRGVTPLPASSLRRR
jgi:hypothetical protein